MVDESTTKKRKRIFDEICKKRPDIDNARPYSVTVYDPSAVSNETNITVTRESLQAAIRILLELLDNDPGYTGEIFMYERRKKQIIYSQST